MISLMKTRPLDTSRPYDITTITLDLPNVWMTLWSEHREGLSVSQAEAGWAEYEARWS